MLTAPEAGMLGFLTYCALKASIKYASCVMFEGKEGEMREFFFTKGSEITTLLPCPFVRSVPADFIEEQKFNVPAADTACFRLIRYLVTNPLFFPASQTPPGG